MLETLVVMVKHDAGAFLLQTDEGSRLIIRRGAIKLSGFHPHQPEYWNPSGSFIFYDPRHGWIGVAVRNSTIGGHAHIPLMRTLMHNQRLERWVSEANAVLHLQTP